MLQTIANFLRRIADRLDGRVSTQGGGGPGPVKPK